LVVKNSAKSTELDFIELSLLHKLLLDKAILSKDNLEVITLWISLSQLLSRVLLDVILLKIILELLALLLLLDVTSLLLVVLYKYPDKLAWKIFIILYDIKAKHNQK
jgi:hypothetical protein